MIGVNTTEGENPRWQSSQKHKQQWNQRLESVYADVQTDMNDSGHDLEKHQSVEKRTKHRSWIARRQYQDQTQESCERPEKKAPADTHTRGDGEPQRNS